MLVSPYRIQCVTMSDLDNGVELVRGRSEHWFADRPEFRADTNVVMRFIELAKKLFQFDAVP